MTKDELIMRLQAGERVTLYHARASYVGVGSRTFHLDPIKKKRFSIVYDDGSISKFTHGLNSPLLDALFRANHMQEFWWVAYARSVALNQEFAAGAKQDA